MDFKKVVDRFEALGNGPKAELRRCVTPDDVGMVPSFYRLFPGVRTTEKHLRVAFFLPYAKQAANSDSLGAQLSKENISERRIFQVLRSEAPNDLIQLRRLVQQVEPQLDWQDFGWRLFKWGKDEKRRIIEDFFMNQASK
jgi:CRISPR system Cascade subunit CasB